MINVLILGGVHGNEVAASYVATLFKKSKWTEDSRINLKVISDVNLKVGETREYTCDLNRHFGSDQDIKIQEVRDAIQECDVVIDIHNSENCWNFLLLDLEQDIIHRQYAKAAGITYGCRPSVGNTIKKFANSLGKLSFTYEFSPMEFSSSRVETAYKDIDKLINVLLLPKESIQKLDTADNIIQEFSGKHQGFILPNYTLGNIHTEPLAQVVDLSGNIVEQIIVEDFQLLAASTGYGKFTVLGIQKKK